MGALILFCRRRAQKDADLRHFGTKGYKMSQLYEYFDQNRSIDHKNIMKHKNQATEAVIKTNSLREIFLGHPVPGW